MRRLLRNLDTGTFFKAEGAWTSDPLEAAEFNNDQIAVSLAKSLGVTNLELLSVSDDGTPVFSTRLTTTGPTRPKLLVVDDDPLIHMLYKGHLTKAGYDMSSARNGIEALTVAAEVKPDIILMDLLMPGLDGLGALRELKEHDVLRLVPVIIVTAEVHEYTANRSEAENCGAVGFLTKPFSPAQLLSELNRVFPIR